jgi:hypothetical protein
MLSGANLVILDESLLLQMRLYAVAPCKANWFVTVRCFPWSDRDKSEFRRRQRHKNGGRSCIIDLTSWRKL